MSATDILDDKVIGFLLAALAIYKVVDRIGDRLGEGKSKEAVRQALALSLILLMFGGLWVGYRFLPLILPKTTAPEPPAQPTAPVTPNTSADNTPKAPHRQPTISKGRGRSEKPTTTKSLPQLPQTAEVPPAVWPAGKQHPSAPATATRADLPESHFDDPSAAPASQPSCTASPSPTVILNIPGEKKPELDQMM
jgi:hypothetical protein